MQYYRFPEKKIWKLLFALFLLLQLFVTRSGMSATLIGFLPSQILMLGLIFAAGILFLWKNMGAWKQIFTDIRLAAAFGFVCVFLIPMVCKQDWQLMYITILMGMLLAVLLSYFVTLRETAKTYVLVLCVLAVYSLLATYVLRRPVDAGVLPVPRFINGAGHEFYFFGLANVSVEHVASRNFGILREPGVYQFFLLIGLYLTNYEVSWERSRSMWAANGILGVTLLSTQATGGVIALGLFVVVVFFEKKMYQNKAVLWIAILGAAAAAVIVVWSFIQQNAIYSFIYNTLLEKFINRTDSVTERADGIVWNLTLFFRNPIFGANLAQVLHGVNNNTSSTLILFSGAGVLAGVVHILGWIALVWRRERNLIWNLGLLAVLFMGFNTQNLTWDLYFWLFPTMALLERGITLLRRERK